MQAKRFSRFLHLDSDERVQHDGAWQTENDWYSAESGLNGSQPKMREVKTVYFIIPFETLLGT